MPKQTRVCHTCKATHPVTQGISVFINHYACPCGAKWADVWCSACDDECPACSSDISPSSSDELVIIPPDHEDQN